ncbi:unnamed protein product [Echinostoma caproni]|uniref:Annexin n=1 Tax=Echinostoma caproni TaxID=27848 RepID=A0A183AF08_9TREM|nr:unnamed protein product [Echinostoma caproni]
MPVTGGITAPKIIPLKQYTDGTSNATIDTATYIELKCETPNSRIFFTTDGSNPNPWRKKVNGREKTFSYKAPFALRSGRRVVKAMAVHNVTQVESHVVTKQFMVSDLNESDSENDQRYEEESTGSDMDYDRYETQHGAIVHRHETQPLDESMDNFLRRNADQGFAATNHSGTQINLWGQVPGLNWDVRTPNSTNIYGSYFNPVAVVPPIYQPSVPSHVDNSVTPQQLSMIATQLSQCIDQTRHMTIAEVRELLKQMTDKISASNKLEAPHKAYPLLAISQGGGDLPGQLEHIHSHLLEYTRRDPRLSALISNARMGKILSADFDEGDSSFLLTVQLENPLASQSYRPAQSSVERPRTVAKKTDKEDKFKEPSEPPQPVPSLPEVTSSQKSLSKNEEKSEAKPTPSTPIKSAETSTDCKHSETTDDSDPAWEIVEDSDSGPYSELVGGGYASHVGFGTGMPMGSGYTPGLANPSDGFQSYPGVTDPFMGPSGENFPGCGQPNCSFDSGSTPNPILPPAPPSFGNTGYQPGAPSNRSSFPSGNTEPQSDMKFPTPNAGAALGIAENSLATNSNAYARDSIAEAIGGFTPLKPHEDIYAPTLKPFPNFNAFEDCERLKKAMKGLGTDEKTIIDIMGHRSVEQRTKIVLQFKTMYGKDLIKEFKSELSGHFSECVEALCYSPEDFDAMQLRKAVKGAGTDEDALIEILCSRTNEQIRKVKEAYKRMHDRDLEKDVINDTSRYFKRILVSLLQANRDESTTVDREAARRDAEELYKAGEKRLGTDESKFIMILGSKSFAHLRVVFEEYGKVSKNDIEKALKSEMSGDLLKSMLSIVRCIKNKQKYFAYQLLKSMKGLGTRDRTLIRIIVSRCEIDLARIKEEFQKDYGKTLEHWVSVSKSKISDLPWWLYLLIWWLTGSVDSGNHIA